MVERKNGKCTHLSIQNKYIIIMAMSILRDWHVISRMEYFIPSWQKRSEIVQVSNRLCYA